MSADTHIYISVDELAFTVQQEGVDGSRIFSSLSEATRHVRGQSLGFVVIHDELSKSANRIPLGFYDDQKPASRSMVNS